MKVGSLGRLMIVFGVAAGCHRSPMSPAEGTHAGEWSGLTSQGAPISFTVSSTERVIALSVGYDFNGCSGAKTFSGLDVAINTASRGLSALLPPGTEQFAGFTFRDGAQGASNATQLAGVLKSETTATGAVSFENYGNCTDGFANATWNATKIP